MKQTIIEALQSALEIEHEITKETILKISKQLNVPESEVYGVATFYTRFKAKKNVKYNVKNTHGKNIITYNNKKKI